MSEYWESTGPAGFGSHTVRQSTLLLLVQNDGGYAITYGCTRVIRDGDLKIEIYYSPHKVKSLIEKKSRYKNEKRNGKDNF